MLRAANLASRRPVRIRRRLPPALARLTRWHLDAIWILLGCLALAIFGIPRAVNALLGGGC